MKYYRQMAELGCFSAKQLAGKLACCEATAHSIIQSYVKKNYIARVRQNLYVPLRFETDVPILDKFQIGSQLFPDAYITHHTAFEYYGVANQVYEVVYVATESRFKDFEFDGLLYKRIAPAPNVKIREQFGVKVSTLEQTAIDSIKDLDKLTGLEEVVRCLMLVPSLNSKKLLEILENYNNGFLYQKSGYILQELNSRLHLPESFFQICKERSSNAKKYLTANHKNLTWNKDWGIYAPESLNDIVNKGVYGYDAICGEL